MTCDRRIFCDSVVWGTTKIGFRFVIIPHLHFVSLVGFDLMNRDNRARGCGDLHRTKAVQPQAYAAISRLVSMHLL